MSSDVPDSVHLMLLAVTDPTSWLLIGAFVLMRRGHAAAMLPNTSLGHAIRAFAVTLLSIMVLIALWVITRLTE